MCFIQGIPGMLETLKTDSRAFKLICKKLALTSKNTTKKTQFFSLGVFDNALYIID